MNVRVDPDTVDPKINVMNKKDKLLRLAKLVREYSGNLFVYNGLEYQHRVHFAMKCINSTAFELAAADPVFQALGHEPQNLLDSINFFELRGGACDLGRPSADDELHEFSCDCGGSISNAEMADRIEAIALRG